MHPSTTPEYLDALKTRLNLRSDYALAKRLGVTTVTMMRWRAGGSFNDANAMHVADLLDLPRAYVLACMGAQRAEDGESGGVWRQIADMCRDKVALWALASLVIFSLCAPSAPAVASSAVRNNVYYGKSRRFRGRRRLHKTVPAATFLFSRCHGCHGFRFVVQSPNRRRLRHTSRRRA